MSVLADGRILIPSGAQLTYAWRLDAATLTVNETSSVRSGAGPPGSQNRTANLYASPPRQSERQWTDAQATGTASIGASNLLATALEGTNGPLSVAASAKAVDLRPLVGKRWASGSAAQDVSLTGNSDRSTQAVEMPGGWTQAKLKAAEVRLQGDIELVLWENEFTVSAGGAEHKFRSGAQTRDAYPSPLGVPALARETNETLIRVRAYDAILVIHLEIGDLIVAGPRLDVAGDVSATFRDAAGKVGDGTRVVVVGNEPVVVSGRLQLSTWNATSGERLRGDLGVSDGEITLPTRGDGTALATTELASAPKVSALTWILLAVVATTAVLVWRLRRGVSLDDVEWHLLNGNLRRGQTLARRLVRSRPQDADAMFLYASTLLAQAKHAELVARLEPMASTLAPDVRRGIAYVLAVAAHAIGDGARSQRWAQEAAAEPLLRARMLKDGLWTASAIRSEPAGYA